MVNRSRTAQDAKNFAEYGSDYLWCLATIASTTSDAALKARATRMALERGREWRRIHPQVPKDADAATAFAARRKIIAEVEKESLDRTGLRSDVVTLWQGGAYHLYRFKRYTDVRIVFAPEQIGRASCRERVSSVV